MRLLAALSMFLFLLPAQSFAQEWKTIKGTDFIPTVGFFTSGSGWRPGNKQFAVSPFDASIWMAMNNEVHGFDASGNYFVYDYNNVPLFTSNGNLSTFLEFGFTSSSVFAVDRYIGLLRFDGANWTLLSSQDYGNAISADQDSVWVAYENMNYITWKDGFTTQGNTDVFQRIVSRNGELWGCGSTESGFIYRLDNGSPVLYNAFTESYLLDNSNLDFKFANDTDTLYCAGEQGFSLAYQGAFIDTITTHNSINMPSGVIREFEFDHEDNIWALFGDDVNDYSSVAHYDQATNTWDMYYDNSNSPVAWGSRITIDLDGEGNLYVHDRNDIHILKINNWPQWLGIDEAEKIDFRVYPNPSIGVVTIDIDESADVRSIEILDVLGREVKSLPFSNSLSLAEPAGIYYVNLIGAEGVLGTEKIIIR